MAMCPKCHSKACIKDGIIKNKQRFKCKECGYRHTVAHRGLSLDIRRQALQLYLAGLGFRSIGRLLQCSHVTISQWIKEHGESVKSIRAESELTIVKTNDVHTYIDSRQPTNSSTTLVIDIKTDSTALCIPVTPKQQKITANF